MGEIGIDFSVALALNWILFLALFPIAFVWLRRAWRIVIHHDYSEVALRRGEPPPDAERWAPYTAAVNFIGGIVAVYVIVAVVGWAMPYEQWTAIAGATIWLKLILDFAISRHAHWRAKWNESPPRESNR